MSSYIMKNKKYIYIYYALLLVVLASRQTATTPPPMILRLAFMAAVIAPALLDKEVCYPAILTMFYTISLDGFAFSYMPYTLSLYLVITLAITLFFSRSVETGTIPIFVVLFAIYLLVIDLIFSPGRQVADCFQSTFFCFVLMGCFLIISSQSIESALSQLPLCFAVTTVVLSIAFLTHRDQFVIQEIYTKLG